MEWETLKEKIYYWDGSWLDIYVQNANQDDWKKWLDFVNDKYQVSFYNGKTGRKENKISFTTVKDHWDGNSELMNDAIIKLGAINVKCHFFVCTEIEMDFDPGEVKGIEEHNALLEYMIEVSKLLGKKIILTPENSPDLVHISVEKGEVRIKVN
jgi:hypothetical protein